MKTRTTVEELTSNLSTPLSSRVRQEGSTHTYLVWSLSTSSTLVVVFHSLSSFAVFFPGSSYTSLWLCRYRFPIEVYVLHSGIVKWSITNDGPIFIFSLWSPVCHDCFEVLPQSIILTPLWNCVRNVEPHVDSVVCPTRNHHY